MTTIQIELPIERGSETCSVCESIIRGFSDGIDFCKLFDKHLVKNDFRLSCCLAAETAAPSSEIDTEGIIEVCDALINARIYAAETEQCCFCAERKLKHRPLCTITKAKNIIDQLRKD